MASARRKGSHALDDLIDPEVAFAEAVYAPSSSRSEEDRFAAAIEGPGDEISFHPPGEIRAHWVAEWKARIRDDYDNVIVASAKKGRGKSTLGISVGRWLCGERFTLDHVVFRGADLVSSYASFARGEVVVYDEAVLSLLSTDFATVESRDLVKAVTLARDAHLTTVLCLPRFFRLNKAFREDLVDYWLRVDDRGTAVVHPASTRERYSEWKGLGYFPDVEWNPLTWDSLKGEPLWAAYLKKRIAARRTFHGVVIDRLEHGAATADRTRDTRDAQGPFRCELCHRQFGRRDHYSRHLTTREHRERTAGPPPVSPP